VDVVWRLLVEVDRWPEWGPSVRAVHLDQVDRDEERIRLGSRGTVEAIGGVRLPFEVTELDEGRRWAWRVRGVQATDHTVEPVDAGCRVTFGVPWPFAPYLAVCERALRHLEHLARPDL
jgi:hypothetical protein